ncbi:hypothetical protein [Chryseobacterium sp. SIMBA_029]|uniref:hypothetical protein n=1 Tax=Chryseobacterium sp. SIMBA_029 TaxID=3085772 RepID=UPI0039790CDA
MKRIALLIFLSIASLALSQTNTIQIINFTPNNIQFRLAGRGNQLVMDCQPLITAQGYTTLNSGQSVTYTQYNTAQLVNPPIYTWDVIAEAVGGTSYTANPSTGNIIPAFVSNVSRWGVLDIISPAGDYYRLEKACEVPGGVFSTPPGATVTASWSELGGNVLVVITP